MAILLRLAVLLNRVRRSSRPLPALTLELDRQTLTLGCPQRWLDDHPLLIADLEREREELAILGLTLAARAVA